MAFERTFSNFRVETTPYHPISLLEPSPDTEEWVRACEQIKKEIKRHVDDVEVLVAHDVDFLCSYCHTSREYALDDFGDPACCTPAVDEWEEERLREKDY